MVGLGVTTVGRNDPPAITLSDASLGYGGRPVLKGLSLTIPRGSMMALVGPNGGGKSTLLRAIAGELKPLSGRVEIGARRRSTIAFLPQEDGFDRSFPISVRDVVAMGLWRRLGPFARIGRPEAEVVQDALAAVRLAELGRRPIGELSGGELQRVLFARIIAMDATVILLDEPFAAIDRETVGILLEVVRAWHQQERTIIAALHDFDAVRRSFPSTIRLDGEQIKAGPTGELLPPTTPRAAAGAAA